MRPVAPAKKGAVMFGFNNSSGGWIGIDRGGRALKIAQLRRIGQRLELSVKGITPRWNAARSPISPGSSLDGGEQCRRELEAAHVLGGKCTGRQAAALTSMSVCTINTDDNLANSATADQCVDRWQAGPDSSYSLSLPEAEVNDLCHGVEQAGFQCLVVDGLPLALARALTLATSYRSDELVAALDWGGTSATLVAARAGQAVYARKLKLGNFGSVLESVALSLQLSESEAEKVVLRYGVRNNQDSDPVAKAVSDALTHSSSTLVSEIQATFSHLEGKLKTRHPQRLEVFGMGATVPGLPEWIGSKCDVQASAWHPEGIVTEDSFAKTPPCLFGPAIALSMLVWKTQGGRL